MQLRWTLGLLLAACGPHVKLPPGSDDSSTGADSTSATPTTSTTTTTTSAGTGPMTSTSGPVETTDVDPDPTTGTVTLTDPTSATVTSDTSSESGDCPPDGQCVVDSDCPSQGKCIACLCFGGCEPDGDANYGGCLLADGTSDTTVCNDDAAVCVVDQADMPAFGVCVPGCAAVCECPPAPGFDEQVRCEDITGDGLFDCTIDCSNGESCPEGMACVLDAICMWPPT